MNSRQFYTVLVSLTLITGALWAQSPNYLKARKLFSKVEYNRDLSLRKEIGERILKLAPDSEYAWVVRGWRKSRQGDSAGARKAYERAYKINPKFTSAINHLAITYTTDDKEKAIKYFAIALSTNPEDPNILYNLGDTLCDVERYKEGLPHLLKATGIAPEIPAPWRSLVRVYHQSNKGPELIQAALNYKWLAPNWFANDAWLLRVLGRAYARTEKIAPALKYVQQSCNLKNQYSCNGLANIRKYLKQNKVVVMETGFQTGKQYMLTLKNSKSKYKNNKLIKTGGTISQVRVKVKSGTRAGGYILSWTYEDVKAHKPMAELTPTSRYILQASKGLKVLFEIDENGQFVKVLNQAAIRKYLQKMLNPLMKLNEERNKGKTTFTPQEKAKMKILLRKMINSNTGLRGAVEPIKQVFLLGGRPIQIGEIIKYTHNVPSIYGGKPIANTTSLQLERYDESSKIAFLKIDTTVDPALARKYVLEVFRKILKDTGKPIPPDLEQKVPSLKVSGNIKIQYSVGQGHLLHLQERKFSGAGGDYQEKFMEIHMKEAK